MRILYVTTISSTINAFLVPHILVLLEQGHIVDCACCVTKEVKETLTQKGVKVHSIPFSRNPLKVSNFKAYKQLIAIQKEYQYDVIHCHTPVAGIYGRLLKRINKNLITMYTVHGFHFFRGASWVNWFVYYPIEKMMSKYTDYLITITKEDYQMAKAYHFQAGEITRINGVGVQMSQFPQGSKQLKHQLREQYGYDQDITLLFYAAEINVNKNQQLLLETVSKLIQSGKSCKLLLAGDGHLQCRLREKVRELKIDNHVEFLGDIKEVAQYLQMSDICVASSSREGLPVNVMEAMCIGLPIVAKENRGHRELITEGENGFLIKGDDSKKMAARIQLLMENEEMRTMMGTLGHQKMEQEYRLEYVLQQLRTIYSFLNKGGKHDEYSTFNSNQSV